MVINIPSDVEYIIGQLESRGYEAYAVGGCVRDTLLNKEPDDWDITTSAKPQEIKKIFRRTIDTGIEHGTVTVMMDNTGYEVTTYRIDGKYEDGRHPSSVEFTPSLTEDLKRRDFTINAMAYSRTSGIVDKFGGMADLDKHLIRCVGNPADRFGEDALRILRAVRFSAQLGFTIEPKTREAIHDIAPNLIHVSKERIQAELTKLLLSDNPDMICLVFSTGISEYISGTFSKLENSSINIPANLPVIKHIRIAAFLKQLQYEDAEKILRELKFDNDTIRRVKILVEYMPKSLHADKYEIRKTLSIIGTELFDDLLLLKNAYKEAVSDIKALEKEILLSNDCISLKTLAVSGNDLIACGIRPGKDIGDKLADLFEEILKHPELNIREELLKRV